MVGRGGMLNRIPDISKQANRCFPCVSKPPGDLEDRHFWPCFWFREACKYLFLRHSLGSSDTAHPEARSAWIHLKGTLSSPRRAAPESLPKAKFTVPVCAHWRQPFISRAPSDTQLADSVGASFDDCLIGQFISQLGKEWVCLVADYLL